MMVHKYLMDVLGWKVLFYAEMITQIKWKTQTTLSQFQFSSSDVDPQMNQRLASVVRSLVDCKLSRNHPACLIDMASSSLQGCFSKLFCVSPL